MFFEDMGSHQPLDLSSPPRAVKSEFFRPWEHGVPTARKTPVVQGEISVPAPLIVVTLPAQIPCISNPSAVTSSSSNLQVPSRRSPGLVARPAGTPSPPDCRATSPTDSAYSSSTSTCSPRSSPRLQPSTTGSSSSQMMQQQQQALGTQQQHMGAQQPLQMSPGLLPGGCSSLTSLQEKLQLQTQNRKCHAPLDRPSTPKLQVLESWYSAHSDMPYPSNKETKQLAKECGLNFHQVRKWMSKRRGNNHPSQSSNGKAYQGTVPAASQGVSTPACPGALALSAPCPMQQTMLPPVVSQMPWGAQFQGAGFMPLQSPPAATDLRPKARGKVKPHAASSPYSTTGRRTPCTPSQRPSTPASPGLSYNPLKELQTMQAMYLHQLMASQSFESQLLNAMK